jgi:hypothetical protein
MICPTAEITVQSADDKYIGILKNIMKNLGSLR